MEPVYIAIVWLARENKIEFDEQNGITSFYVNQERYDQYEGVPSVHREFMWKRNPCHPCNPL